MDTKFHVRGTVIALLLVHQVKIKFTFIIALVEPIQRMYGHIIQVVSQHNRRNIQYRVRIVVLPVDDLVGRSQLQRMKVTI